MEEKITKQRALELWDSGKINEFEVGSTRGLQDIHSYLFHGLKGYGAGEIREVNMSKGAFRFASALYLTDVLKTVEAMPEATFEQIMDKYIEMNVAHPFKEGNGRSTRIWLDLILKKNLGICIDWEKIDKNDYLRFMELSPIDGKYIKMLLKDSLTDNINSRTVYMKGIDRSYEYESEDAISIFEIDQSNHHISNKSKTKNGNHELER